MNYLGTAPFLKEWQGPRWIVYPPKEAWEGRTPILGRQRRGHITNINWNFDHPAGVGNYRPVSYKGVAHVVMPTGFAVARSVELDRWTDCRHEYWYWSWRDECWRNEPDGAGA